MAKKISNQKFRQRKLETSSLLKKLRHFLRYRPQNVIFKKISGSTLGFYELELEIITIDYRKEIIPTLIHEFIHHLHKNWCETKVIAKEKQIMTILTLKQVHDIIILLDRCFENEEES